MSLFTKSVKTPDVVPAANTAQADATLDADRKRRAQSGGRGASFLWDAPPITPTAPRPTLFGQGG